jgi:hypothetical protein
MSDRIVAYCGSVCTECPAYIATQANDHEALERTAAQWREAFNAPELTAETIVCDGCLTNEGRRCIHCSKCEIRACVVGRDLTSCAHCSDYACDRLKYFHGEAPVVWNTLDGIRQSLAQRDLKGDAIWTNSHKRS